MGKAATGGFVTTPKLLRSETQILPRWRNYA